MADSDADASTGKTGNYTLAAGDGLDPGDPAAIIVRKDLPDGRVYGTTSVTLVALAEGALRYDFQPNPGRSDGWYAVPLG